MTAFALLSVPIFCVVALGWAAIRLHLIPPASIDSLGAFSFRFALPALVFRIIATQPLGRSFNPIFYIGYLASGAMTFAIVFALSRTFGHQRASAAGAHATTATVSNLGFLGPPLMVAFFGSRSAGPLAMAILAEVMVLLSLGGAIMGSSRRGGNGWKTLLIASTIRN